MNDEALGFISIDDGKFEAFWFPLTSDGEPTTIPVSLGVFDTELAAGAAVYKAVLAEVA